MGGVQVFVRNEEGWVPQAYLKPSTPDGGDEFGKSLAISADGSIVAVGAPGEDSTASGINGDGKINGFFGSTYIDAGAVYLFYRETGSWAQRFYIKPAHTAIYQSFGASLAMSANGQRLVVGAPGDPSLSKGLNSDPENYDAEDLLRKKIAGLSTLPVGAAYIFNHNGTTWEQAAYIKAPNAEADDQFGWQVAISANGQHVAVTSLNEASNAQGIQGNQENRSTVNAGAVYVYSLGDSGWNQPAYVKASNTRSGLRFGSGLSLSADGEILAVGAHREQSKATGINGDQEDESAPSAGAVYLY